MKIISNPTIVLNNPAEVQEFVNIASTYDFDIDLKVGDLRLNAKSFLGVLTQAMTCRMQVIAHGRDRSFRSAIKKFAVA